MLKHYFKDTMNRKFVVHVTQTPTGETRVHLYEDGVILPEIDKETYENTKRLAKTPIKVV